MSDAFSISPPLRQHYPLPSAPSPIVLIGAGGIANDAHLPAYAKAGFPVVGVLDLDGAKARATAERWRIGRLLDTIRALAGDPRQVLARTYHFPGSELADTRTSAILDYGDELRVTLSINHHHDFGRRFQDATFRVEGDRGAALVKLGLLLDYPRGEPDELWLAPRGGPWEPLPLDGGWFPDAFIGTMSNLQRYAAGEDEVLKTSVEDAWYTMALVESCYSK